MSSPLTLPGSVSGCVSQGIPAVQASATVVAAASLSVCSTSGAWLVELHAGTVGGSLAPVATCTLGHFRSRSLARAAALALLGRVAPQLAQRAPASAVPPAAPSGPQLGLALA